MLALKPEQIDVDSVREIGRPAALARDFDDYHTIARVQCGAAMTEAQRESLERIAELFARMTLGSPGLWGERAVLHDAEWAAVRAAAQQALQAFGWVPLHSDPRSTIEQARWVRYARAGLWLGPGSLLGWLLVGAVISRFIDNSKALGLLMGWLLVPVLACQVTSAILCAQAGPAWRLRPVPFPVRALTALWLFGPLLLLALLAVAVA